MSLFFTCSDNVKYIDKWLDSVSRRFHSLLSFLHPPGPCQLVLPRVPAFSCRWAPNGLQKSVCPYPVDSESHSPAAVSVLPFLLETQHPPHPSLW